MCTGCGGGGVRWCEEQLEAIQKLQPPATLKG